MRTGSSLAIFILVAGFVLAAEAPAALAQGTFSGTVNIEIRIPPPGNPMGTPIIPNSQQQLEYFNRANCVCNQNFFAFLTAQNVPQSAIPAQIWVGTNCADDQLRPMQCARITDIADVRTLRTQTSFPIPLAKLAAPITGTCPASVVNNSVYVLVDVNMNGTRMTSFTKQISVDAQAPPEVKELRLSGGEKAVVSSWKIPDERPDDIFQFQMLCARADGSASANDHLGGTAKYATTFTVCATEEAGSVPRAPAGTTANPAALPDPLRTLNPANICASASGGSNTSLRAEKLENGIDYRVVLVIADKALNPTALDLGVIRPQPSIDFWESYRAAGGGAEGGFGCQAARGDGSLGLAIVGAILLGALVLRRRRWPASLVAVAILITQVANASAQPYFDEEPENSNAGPAIPHWNVGVKVGPYFPEVDSELPATRPFRTAYGKGPFVMAKADLDRYFFFPLGQLGLTASFGFLQKSAKAFEDNGAGQIRVDDSGRPVRSQGDRTSFWLVPASVGVVYRFTEIDDRWHIPIVPYGKAALAYYFWWVTDPSGSIAEASTDPACNPSTGAMCRTTDGLGASLGFETTVGLAVRAERIDPDTASALTNDLGIEHAGLYVELLYANVDGFGKSDKLSVGDLTWFGGINFEF